MTIFWASVELHFYGEESDRPRLPTADIKPAIKDGALPVVRAWHSAQELRHDRMPRAECRAPTALNVLIERLNIF